ncbi:MAG: hypothetical protein ACI91G_001414, partial [Gammaproteobacteria bacterium]
ADNQVIDQTPLAFFHLINAPPLFRQPKKGRSAR